MAPDGTDPQARDLSIEAFTRAYRKPLHPCVQNGREALDEEEQERGIAAARARAQERRELNRLWRALMLASDRETLHALLAGEQVPVSRLDPLWLRRFKRR